jgi:flagellar hook-associated protein FlgK
MGSIGMTTGLRALLATRFALDTAGHNISNVATPGYSRQLVDLAAAYPVNSKGMLVGTGVETMSVRRNVDSLLHRRILGQSASLAAVSAKRDGLSELETLFNEPGNGLGGLMNDWFSKVSDLSAGPEDDILRTGLVAAGEDMSFQFRQVRGQMGELRDSFAAQIGLEVDHVNELAARISEFNREIGKSEVGGSMANDLRDARDETLRELSELVDIQSIEDSQGVVRVIASGALLVDSAKAHEMTLDKAADGTFVLHVQGMTGDLSISGGKLGGLYGLYREKAPAHIAELDKIAHELIRSVNRVHATGVPKSGPFTSLLGSYRLQDKDGDAQRADELLADAGLPFEIQSGTLYVGVSDAQGNLSRHAISISATHTTVQDFLDELNGIDHLSANIDALGRLQIASESGYGFDFSARLDPHPDDSGTFGGAAASLGAAQGPYALADGDTLTVNVGTGAGSTSVSITLAQADFAAIGAATADELADAINAAPGVAGAGLRAVSVDGALYLQTIGTGANASLTVAGGSAVGALGLSGQVGAVVSGSATGVEVEISGAYTGDQNGKWTFRPNMDGAIGTTSGLQVDVLDSSGATIATLDVGAGYQPGAKLQIGDGVSVSFGIGDLSATHGDAFALDVVGQPDTTDALVALGLNGFFTGSDASDIAVREELRSDTDLVAASASGAVGDAGIMLALLDVQDAPNAQLGGDSVHGKYSDLVGTVGFEVAAADAAMEANQSLLDSLSLRREEISGVNIDEEMVRVMQLEQSYTAAVQYIATLNELHEDLFNLL